MRIATLLLTLLSIVLVSTANARNNHTCGIEQGKPLTNHYGPFDYNNPAHAIKFPVVLKRHFTDEIRLLTSYKAEGDLDYTLRAIPNFLPALESMARLQQRWKRNNEVHQGYYTAECYFERAIYFAPRDINVRYLYAVYLHQSGNYKKAETFYHQVLNVDNRHIEANYNLALMLLETGDFDNALHHAKIAYEGNFPLTGLKNKLIKLGLWQ